MPNMNVLIAIGATAAFIYSVVGAIIFSNPEYLFFETAAAIITLVFLGNYLEDASIPSSSATKRHDSYLSPLNNIVLIFFFFRYSKMLKASFLI